VTPHLASILSCSDANPGFEVGSAGQWGGSWCRLDLEGRAGGGGGGGGGRGVSRVRYEAYIIFEVLLASCLPACLSVQQSSQDSKRGFFSNSPYYLFLGGQARRRRIKWEKGTHMS
jgi:hypothetical protein